MANNRFDAINDETWDQTGETAGEIKARSFPFTRTVVVKNDGVATILWKIGSKDDSVDITHSEVELMPDLGSMGWIRFQDQKVVEEGPRVPLFGHPKPDRPASYSDRERWPRWQSTDRRVDPWVFRPHLPFRFIGGEMDGQIGIFSGDSEGGRTTIGDALLSFKEHRRRPIALLTSARRTGDGTLEPFLQITGHSESDDIVPGLAVKARGTAIATPKLPGNGDATAGGDQSPVDDQIPFAPEVR